MTKKVLVETPGDTSFLPGRMVDRLIFDEENEQVVESGGEPATCEEIILGITKASLATESFLSAASFQETTKVLTDAALEGKVDELRGLKENVIIGKLIPAATGLRSYRNIELVTAGIPAEMDVFGDVHGRPLRAAPVSRPSSSGRSSPASSHDVEAYNMLVDDLDLPTYVHSVLSRAGIERVSDLLGYTTKELMAIPGLGQKSLEEVRARLAEQGWTLATGMRKARRRAAEDGEDASGRRRLRERRARRPALPAAATSSTPAIFADEDVAGGEPRSCRRRVGGLAPLLAGPSGLCYTSRPLRVQARSCSSCACRQR